MSEFYAKGSHPPIPISPMGVFQYLESPVPDMGTSHTGYREKSFQVSGKNGGGLRKIPHHV